MDATGSKDGYQETPQRRLCSEDTAKEDRVGERRVRRSPRGSKRKALSRSVNGPAKCHRSAGATAVRSGTRQFSMEGSPGTDRAYEEHSSQLASINKDSGQSPEEIQPATSTATLLFQTPLTFGQMPARSNSIPRYHSAADLWNSCKWENETREVRPLDVSTAIRIAHMTARTARRKTACNQPAQTPASQLADAQHATRLASKSAVTRASNHFIQRGAHTTFGDWKFIHRARLNVLANNGRPWNKKDRSCRKCGHSNETLSHILNSCRPNLIQDIKRHDAIITEIARSLPSTELRLNKQVPGSRFNLRPDIVLLDKANNRACILDVQCPFDLDEDSLVKARTAKTAKYQCVAEELRSSGLRVYSGAIIIGSLGSFDGDNFKSLAELGIPRRQCTALAKTAKERASQHTAEAQVVVAPASMPAAAPASEPAQADKMLAAPPAIEQPTPTSPQVHPAAASSTNGTTEPQAASPARPYALVAASPPVAKGKTPRAGNASVAAGPAKPQNAAPTVCKAGASKGTGKIDRVTAEAAMEESKKAVTPCTTPINRVWMGEGKGRKLAGINILMPQADSLEEFRCDKAPCRHASKKFSTLAYLVHHLKCSFKNLNVRIMCSSCKEVASTCHMARKHKCPVLQTGRQGEAHRGAGEQRSTPTKAAPTRSVVTQTPKKFLQTAEQPKGAVRDATTIESSRRPPSRPHRHT